MIDQVLNPNSYISNIYALPMFIVGATITLLGIVMLIREHGSSIGFSFLFMCLCVGLYLFATGANYASRDESLSLFWIRISQLGSVFIPTTILFLTVNRLNLNYRYRFAVAFSFVLSTLFALGVLFTNLHVKGSAPFFWGRFVQYGPLGFVFMGFFFSIMVFVLYLYWMAYQRSSTELQKKRLRGLLLAFSGGYLAAVDFLPTVGLPVYPFGYLPISFFIVMSAYVTVRYKFTDITPELAADQILATIHSAVIVIDLKGKISMISSVAEQMLGYQKSELLGRDIGSILPTLAELNTTALLSGKSSLHEMTWHSSSGQRFEVSVSVSTITNLLDNSPVGIVYAAQDITERKHAEKKLRESEEKYRLIFHNSPIGIFNYDTQLNISDCNDSFIEILRSSRENLIGLDMKILRDQRVLPAIREAIEGTEGIYEGSYRTTTSPAEIHISMHTAPIVDQDGKIKGGVGIVEDTTEHSSMKESLQEQKWFAENLIEYSAVATFVLDAQHKIVFWNKACEELTGIRGSKMIGTDDQWKPFYDHKRPCIADIVLDAEFDKLPDLYTTFAKSTLVPNGYHAEGWYKNLNGRDRYILFDAAPFYDTKGVLIAAIETLQDITERKYAEEEITRSYGTQAVINSLLRLSLEKVSLEDILNRALGLVLSIPWLVGQSKGAIFLVERDPGFLVLKVQRNIDERVQKMCARVPVGKCICGQAALTQKIIFVDSVDERHEISYNDIDPHGHYCVPIIFSQRTLGVVTVYLEDGHKSNEREQELLVTISNTLSGIIIRRQAEDSLVESEQKLQVSEERLQVAVGVSQIGIFDHDQRTDTMYWSPQQRLIHGWSPNEPITLKIFLDLVHPEERESIAASVWLAHDPAGDGIWDVEHRIIRRDGTVHWLKERSQTFFEGEGDARRPVRTIGAVLDITDQKLAEEERKKLQSQLLQSQKMESIGQLAGGIAHDFNNILAAIVGYGNIMQMKMQVDDPLRTHMNQILAGAERAASLTQSLLAFSRKQIINPKNVDLNEIIRKIEKFLTRTIGENIVLSTSLSDNALMIFVDPTQIEQVLMNLATNARDAMPKGGRLAIETGLVMLDDEHVRTHGFGLSGQYAVLKVSDSGEGMDEQTQQKIFEPFFTTKELGRGTGLGLAIVYGIVKQNKGYINVYSEPGNGTTFEIHFPFVNARAGEERHPEVQQPLRGGTETILYAEDNETVRLLNRNVLKEFGYTVIEAADGEEALQKFREHRDRINLFILDVIMPKKSGREIFEEMRQSNPDVKVIFNSGYPADLIQKEVMFEEGIRFISKPSSLQTLLRTVREVLDQ